MMKMKTVLWLVHHDDSFDVSEDPADSDTGSD